MSTNNHLDSTREADLTETHFGANKAARSATFPTPPSGIALWQGLGVEFFGKSFLMPMSTLIKVCYADANQENESD